MSDAPIPPDLLVGAWADVSTPSIILNGETIHRAPKNGVPVEGSMTDGSFNRSITEASTVTLSLHDPQRKLLNSALLTQKSRMNIDQYRFALASVDTNGDELSLTFEDDAVALLSAHATPRKANRKSMTRAQFAKLLVDEEPKLSFFCPELKVIQPIGTKKESPSQKAKDANREYGFPNKIPSNLTVKTSKMSKDQAKVADQIFTVGKSMGADDFTQATACATAIQESTLGDPPGGDSSSVGTFQLLDTWGTKAQRQDVAFSANWFFTRAIPLRAAHPEYTVTQLAQAVQISAFPNAYQQWAAEAKLIYASWSGSDAGASNATTPKKAYEFHRGGAGHRGENSWACLQRLASEVNWLCYVIGYTVYFISQTSLYTSRPIATLDRNTDGVHEIDFSYDLGKPVAEATLTVAAKRWQVDPGAVIKVENSGPASGRWIVQVVARSLYEDTATITLVKPVTQLPEPAPDSASASSAKNKLVVAGALSGNEVISIALGLVSPPPSYQMNANHPGLTLDEVLKGKFETVPFDCSSFVRWCWMEGGHVDICPGGGDTTSIIAYAKTKSLNWKQGTVMPPGGWLAGDVIFPHSSHVVLCGGDGQTVEAEGKLYGITRRLMNQVFPSGTSYFWFRPLPDGA